VQHIGFPFGQRRIAVRQRLGGERRVDDQRPLVHPAHRGGEGLDDEWNDRTCGQLPAWSQPSW
jgi:hypothetical protein